jgi:hypothetical protein
MFSILTITIPVFMIQQAKTYQALQALQIFPSQVLMYLCPLSNQVLLQALHTIRATSMNQLCFLKVAQLQKALKLQVNNFLHHQIRISNPHSPKIQ